MPASAAATRLTIMATPDHQPELVAAEPEIGDRRHDGGEQHPVEQTDGDFAQDDAARIAGPRSCVASARTVTVMVCVPALPPIEATIGISTASATICSIVASNRLITEEARMAVPRLTSSQASAGAVVCQTRVGQLLVADAAHAQDVFLGLLLDDVDHVVDGDDADQPLVLVDHRRRRRS